MAHKLVVLRWLYKADQDFQKEKLGIQRQITPEELKKENEKVDKILGKK